MLHTFFFVLSFVMDYHAMADALRSGFILSLIDACVVWTAVLWLSIRDRVISGNRGRPFRSNSVRANYLKPQHCKIRSG